VILDYNVRENMTMDFTNPSMNKQFFFFPLIVEGTMHNISNETIQIETQSKCTRKNYFSSFKSNEETINLQYWKT